MPLDILVGLMKIAKLATVQPCVGMHAMGTLMVLFGAIIITADPREIWARVA